MRPRLADQSILGVSVKDYLAQHQDLIPLVDKKIGAFVDGTFMAPALAIVARYKFTKWLTQEEKKGIPYYTDALFDLLKRNDKEELEKYYKEKFYEQSLEKLVYENASFDPLSEELNCSRNQLACDVYEEVFLRNDEESLQIKACKRFANQLADLSAYLSVGIKMNKEVTSTNKQGGAVYKLEEKQNFLKQCLYQFSILDKVLGPEITSGFKTLLQEVTPKQNVVVMKK